MNEAGKRRARFPRTSWSAVARAGGSDPLSRRAALDELLPGYLPALRSYLVEVRRVPPDAAGDYLQGFVADKLLRAGPLQKADRSRGRFRNLLVRSLDRYVATQLRRRARLPALADDLAELPESRVEAGQHEAFDRLWARQLLWAAVESMRAECEATGRRDVWALFESRVVGPALADAAAPSYRALVEKLGIASPRQAINLLTTGKRAFNRHLQRQVARYAGGPGEAAEEIEDLREILLRTGRSSL